MPAQRRPKTVNVSFALVRSKGRVLIVRRPDSELLGGLWSLPGGEVGPVRGSSEVLRDLVAAQTGMRVDVMEQVARVAHTFSHRRWSGSVVRCVPRGRVAPLSKARWATPEEVRDLPLVPFHRNILEELELRRSLESFAVPARRRRT